MIRLLTFSKLSVLRENRADCDVVTNSLEQLSAVGRTFDCHLLQRLSSGNILDALGNESQQARLRNAVGLRGCDVVLVSACPSNDAGIPEWMRTNLVTCQSIDSLRDSILRTDADSNDVGFQWTHVELPNDDTRFAWLDTALTSGVSVVCEKPDDCLIVTAVAGEIGDSNRFESLLWEERIRLPLLIAGKGMGCERVNFPTGSFDVLETLLSEMGEGIDGLKEDQPVNLASDRHEIPLRSIQVSQHGIDAVRTSDFLLVRSNANHQGEQIALYGKP